MVTVDFDDGFNTKVCSVDNIIIAVYINGVGHWAIEFAEGGLQKCANAEYLSLYNRCDT